MFGVKATADHSIYPGGRLALQWRMRFTRTIGYNERRLELVNRCCTSPVDPWTAEAQSAALASGSINDDFVLNRIDQSGARMDFLQILSRTGPAEAHDFLDASPTRCRPAGCTRREARRAFRFPTASNPGWSGTRSSTTAPRT